MFNKLRAQLASFIAPQQNSMTLGSDFMRYGNRSKMMSADWSDVIIDDRSLYSGYFYAAIRNRASAAATLAKDNVSTEAKNADLVHPYLNLIKESLLFSETDFWTFTSTYMDLEGTMLLMAVRNFDETRIGK